MALQPDGKIIAVGLAAHGNLEGGYQKADFAVVRYNTNGTLDNSFSSDGKTTTSFGRNIGSRPPTSRFRGWQDRGGRRCQRATSRWSVTTPTAAVDTAFGGKAKGIVTTSYWQEQRRLRLRHGTSGGPQDRPGGGHDSRTTLPCMTSPWSATIWMAAWTPLSAATARPPRISLLGFRRTDQPEMAIYASTSPHAGKIVVVAS